MNHLDDMLGALVAATHEPASSLHFTPVRLRARHDGWTPDRQRLFVAGMAATGRTDRAAALVGMSVQSAARIRRRPDGASFAAACSAAHHFAKRLRRARRLQVAEGSKATPGFSLRGSELSETNEPSARPMNLPRHLPPA